MRPADKSLMIKKIYVDNYKSLVNFEMRMRDFGLILGSNGAGKTALFEVLTMLKQFVNDEQKVGEVFPARTLTRWQTRPLQTFELTIEGNGGTYRYRLEVEHSRQEKKRRVQLEELQFDGKKLFVFESGDVQLFRDNFSEGPAYPFDWSRSGLSTILPRGDNKRLTWFKKRLSNVYILRLDPSSMTALSEEEKEAPAPDLSNFASWYRHLSQEDPAQIHKLFQDLERVIEGFSGLRLVATGEQSRVLKVDQYVDEGNTDEASPITFTFDEISDGQRALIALYALLRFFLEKDATLCLDEPGNHITLQEIHPWAMELMEACAEQNSQVAIVSHHPKLIDLLSVEKGHLFERSGAGPTRVQAFKTNGPDELAPSKYFARGWNNE
jgi:predicted ATPase